MATLATSFLTYLIGLDQPPRAFQIPGCSLLHPLQVFRPATVHEPVGLDAEQAIEDPGTRARGSGAFAMVDDRAPLVDDRAGAVDSMGDKHTRFEEALTG